MLHAAEVKPGNVKHNARRPKGISIRSRNDCTVLCCEVMSTSSLSNARATTQGSSDTSANMANNNTRSTLR
eukprot:4986763-Lingulodinium_polyedra.AAC.1